MDIRVIKMNRDNQELYGQIISNLESLDLDTLTKLKEILIANQEQFKTNPVEAIKNAFKMSSISHRTFVTESSTSNWAK